TSSARVASSEPAVSATPAATPSPAAVAPRPTHGCVFVAAAGATAKPPGFSLVGFPEGEEHGFGGYPAMCDAQACPAGLTVDLPKPSDWPYGTYDVDLTSEA